MGQAITVLQQNRGTKNRKNFITLARDLAPTTLNRMTVGIMTLSITALSIMTLSISTLSRMTLL
jgi:hypothetical protein